MLSVVIPAHNEEGCISSTVQHLHLELHLQNIPHETILVDDGRTNSTWSTLLGLFAFLQRRPDKIFEIALVQNSRALWQQTNTEPWDKSRMPHC
jgi:glycosyltransferase involved in cell wall biosynthesis